MDAPVTIGGVLIALGVVVVLGVIVWAVFAYLMAISSDI